MYSIYVHVNIWICGIDWLIIFVKNFLFIWIFLKQPPEIKPSGLAVSTFDKNLISHEYIKYNFWIEKSGIEPGSKHMT